MEKELTQKVTTKASSNLFYAPKQLPSTTFRVTNGGSLGSINISANFKKTIGNLSNSGSDLFRTPFKTESSIGTLTDRSSKFINKTEPSEARFRELLNTMSSHEEYFIDLPKQPSNQLPALSARDKNASSVGYLSLANNSSGSRSFHKIPQSTSKHIILKDHVLTLVTTSANLPATLKISCENKLFPMKIKTLEPSLLPTVYYAYNRIPTADLHDGTFTNVRSEMIPGRFGTKWVGILIESQELFKNYVGCAFRGDVNSLAKRKEWTYAMKVNPDELSILANKQSGDLLPPKKTREEVMSILLPKKKEGSVGYKVQTQEQLYEEYQSINIDVPEGRQ